MARMTKQQKVEHLRFKIVAYALHTIAHAMLVLASQRRYNDPSKVQGDFNSKWDEYGDRYNELTEGNKK